MAAPIQLDRTEGALRGLPADGGVPATLAPVRGKAFPPPIAPSRLQSHVRQSIHSRPRRHLSGKLC